MSSLVNSAAFSIIIALLTGIAPPARAQTVWRVDDDAPGDPGPGDPTISDPLENGSFDHPFDAIQKAVDVSNDTDAVVIADGLYRGPGNRDVDFAGRLITVRSAGDDPSSCVIDCENSGRGFYLHGYETPDATIMGLTIMNGYVDDDSPGLGLGGGVFCRNSSPSITNCLITMNFAGGALGGGGGIYGRNSSLKITDCTITQNEAYHTSGAAGGGVLAEGGGAITLRNCKIVNNYGDSMAAVSCLESDALIEQCLISRNISHSLGGGFFCVGGKATLIDCTITGNISEQGAGVYCHMQSMLEAINCTISDNVGEGLHANNAFFRLSNCIVWRNDPQEIVTTSGVPIVTYCNVKDGWDGPGNIDADPLLTHDGHLRASSPCRNAGDPNDAHANESDRDGEPRIESGRIDIGADEFLDGDGDGLPDWWESRYFGAPDAAAAWGDDDGDERINLIEYYRGANPLRPPQTFYAAPDGNDGWSGLAPEWNGEHGPKATIQAALDAADNMEGDTILLAEGAYTGPLNRNLKFHGKRLTLRSAGDDSAACIIDCAGQGRGFYFDEYETRASIVDSVTITNGAPVEESPGGARGGGVLCSYMSNPTLINCVIRDNHADIGGGIHSRFGSVPALINCKICNNSAGRRGGGVYCYSYAGAEMTNCTITNNRAEEYGGGAYCYYYAGVKMTNCTITANMANRNGGGLYSRDYSYTSVNNCVFWNNDPEDIDVNHDDLPLNHCLIAGEWSGQGNIHADPLFADPDGPDDDPNTWLDNNYSLSPGSPCIDAGDNAVLSNDVLDLDADGDTHEPLPFDLDGNPRFRDDLGMPDRGVADPNFPALPIIDMGACEFQGETCFGDVTGDDVVDQSDLAVLLGNYNAISGMLYSDGDLDGDGDIDLSDLGWLLTRYGDSCR